MDFYNEKMKLNPSKVTTTYLNDYKRYYDIRKEKLLSEKTRLKPAQMSITKKPFEDHETFSKWKENVKIPFDLLLYPKPIVQTDPRTPFHKLEVLPDDDRLKAIKTRPRIYMTPACSMDDVPDPEMRKLLCDYMYTPEWRKAEIEGSKGFKPKIPDISRIDLKDEVSLQTDLYPPLEETFVAIGKKWDDEQIRGFSDPTKEFWKHKEPQVVCGACVNPLQNLVPEETKKEIRKAIRNDRLRLAHDLPSPTYVGYRPFMSKGVTISRREMPTTHPALTTSQAVTSRYAKERQL